MSKEMLYIHERTNEQNKTKEEKTNTRRRERREAPTQNFVAGK
jgi:hypothetical protein